MVGSTACQVEAQQADAEVIETVPVPLIWQR